jgi:nucleotidyltransferase/DNA polymerase involved in DNA repair
MGLKPKIACIMIPHFAVAVERRDDGDLVGMPVVIGGMPHEKGRVYDLSEEAAVSGVEKGISLRQAEEHCPEAVFLPLAEDRYLRAFEELLEVLQAFSPEVEPDDLGKAYLEASGLKALYGDDGRLCRSIVLAIRERTQLGAMLGLASSKFVAWVAAGSAGLREALIVRPGQERSFLRDLPMDLLPMTEEMRRRLFLLGIKTIGAFASLPAQAVATQFGKEGRLAHRLACGRDDRKLIPWHREIALEGSREFDSHIETMDVLLESAKELVGGLIEELRASFRMCQRIVVTLHFDNGLSRERGLAFPEPTYSREKIETNIAQLLRSFEYPCGVSGLSIYFRGMSPEGGKQLQLFVEQTGIDESLDQALIGLVFKYGSDRFCQALLVDRQAPLPENRFSLVEYEPQR